MFNEKWDKRFYELSKHIAQWSQDPSTQVGAVIVDDNKRIISLGFNGFPQGIKDDIRLEDREFKLKTIVHAEVNAILFANKDLSGACLYTWPLPPCSNCASIVIQSGIKRIVCPDESLILDRWKESINLSLKLFEEAGINVVRIK